MLEKYTPRTLPRIALAALAIIVFMAASVTPVGAANVRLVQPVGSKTVYAIINGRLQALRSEAIRKSYSTGLVEQVSQAFVRRLPRVRLVMSQLGPRVYLIDRSTNQKIWFPTEQSFLGSGEQWHDIIVITPEDSVAYRNALLIRAIDSSTIYFLDLQKVERHAITSPADFTARGFNWGDVVVVPKALLEGYARSSPLPSSVLPPDTVERPPQSSDGIPPVAVPSGGVSLAVTRGVATASSFPSGTSRNVVWDMQLTADKSSVEVRSLTLNKRGFTPDASVDGLTVVDERGISLVRPQRFVEGKVRFQFTQPLIVRPREVRTLAVRATFAVAITSTQSFTLGLEKASDVEAGVVVQGNFPLVGPTQTIIPGTSVVGHLTVDAVEISSTPRPVLIGTARQPLSKFSFGFSGGSQDAALDKLVLTNYGNGSTSNFANFDLLDEQNRVVTRTATVSGNVVVMDLGKTPYALPRSQTKTLTLRADVVGGANTTSQLVIQAADDVEAHVVSGGYSIISTAGSFEGTFPVGDGTSSSFNSVQVQPGQISVSLNAQTPVTSITRGATGVVLAAFDARPLGQALRWERMTLRITTAAPHTPLSDTVTLRLKGGNAIGSIDASSVLNQPQVITFAPAPTVQSGKILTIEIIGNVPTAAAISDQYTVELSNSDFIVPGSTDRIPFAATVTGPARTVQDVSLRARADAGFTTTQAVAGARGVKVGRFLLQASAGEPVKVQQVTLATTGPSAVRFSDGFSNLRFGNVSIPAPSGGPYIFTMAVNINPGSEVGFDVFVDTTTAVDGQTVQFTMQDVVAAGATSQVRPPVQLESSVSPSLYFSRGALTITPNGSFAGGLTSKTASSVVGSFVITVGGAESVSVYDFTIAEVTTSSGLSVSRGYKNLRLVNASNGRAISRTVANPVSGSGGNLLTGGPTMGAGQTITFNIVVDATGAAAGDTIQVVLQSVRAQGRVSGVAPTTSGLPGTSAAVSF